MDKAETCKFCKFYKHQKCYRYPPTVLLYDTMDTTSTLPSVNSYDFCGEWVADEAAFMLYNDKNNKE